MTHSRLLSLNMTTPTLHSILLSLVVSSGVGGSTAMVKPVFMLSCCFSYMTAIISSVTRHDNKIVVLL